MLLQDLGGTRHLHEKTEGGKLTACGGRCAVHSKHTEHDVIVLLHTLFSLSYNFKRNCEIVYLSIYINKINQVSQGESGESITVNSNCRSK